MNPIPNVNRRSKLSQAFTPLYCGVAVWLKLAVGIISLPAAADLSDAGLSLAVSNAAQGPVVSWFASNAVAYQVEASGTLTGWTNLTPVLIGNGTRLSVTNTMGVDGFGFIRVKRSEPGVSASFNAASGTLSIFGDGQANHIVIRGDAAGVIHVNGGAVLVTGGVPTVVNTVLIQVFARAGDDYVALDESPGTLPQANVFGEAGNDTIIGGSGPDALDGGPGADTLEGRGGGDTLSGGDDEDTLIGGDGDDVAQSGLGNDRIVWNPGDDSDLIDGGDGVDTIEVNGGNGGEFFTATANGTRVRFDRVEPAPFFLELGGCENMVLNCNGGDDRFAATGNLAALIHLTIDGGPGNDTLLGGDGNDFIDGQQGTDFVLMGAGDDTFQWDPGDGNDVSEGQGDDDTLVLNGSSGNELIELSANGSRLRLTRNLGNIVLDGDGLERVRVNALGGTDGLVVKDLAGTAVAEVNLALGAPLGSNLGDAVADNVLIHCTGANDSVQVAGNAGGIVVRGLRAVVNIVGHEATLDSLSIYGLAGDDAVDASALAGSTIVFLADGGDDDDVLIGSAGVDTLQGGDGDDVLLGGPGIDVLDGGLGNNVVIPD